MAKKEIDCIIFWDCTKCGIQRCNKETHIHGLQLSDKMKAIFFKSKEAEHEKH